MKVIIVVLFALNCLSFCLAGYNSYRTQVTQSVGSEWSDYAYSISSGSCKGRKLVQEDVVLDGEPYTVRKRNYSWNSRGMYRITCIKVTNNMLKNADAAETRITEGGVGQDNTKIEMTSKNSKALDFTVEIWGQESAQHTGIGLISNTASRELYIDGRKYCQC